MFNSFVVSEKIYIFVKQKRKVLWHNGKNGPVVELVYTLRLSRSPYGCGFESHPDYKTPPNSEVKHLQTRKWKKNKNILQSVWQIKSDYISL